MTFCGVPQPTLEDCRAAIIPAPLEATVSYGGGTALGPAAIIQASQAMELYDEVVGSQPMDQGIYTHAGVDVRGPLTEVVARIERAVAEELAADRLPVVLGGEHTVTLGALQALKAARGADFTVLCLDAHPDLREAYQGRRLCHATVMRRALDLGLTVRHLGLRSSSQAEVRLIQEAGLRPLWAHELHEDPHWLTSALEGLSGPVYLSLDVDGLDAGIMPATGTPEPGGLSWQQVTAWLAAVCARHQVLGLDLVELAPLPYQPAWDFTAARLLYRALGLIFKGVS
ncbi:MAG: agmatinase [Desulfarculus sp.]|nr:MAG: agmatinase [Desulfarculus sp.]